jgi:TRAP transporter TAXI family solute receptor
MSERLSATTQHQKLGGIMKRTIWALSICLYASWAWAFTIATGPEDASYFRVGQDIKNVAGKEGVDLQVISTRGSFENIQLLGAGKVELAIVQADAVRFAADFLKEQQGLKLFDTMKVVLCLYPEEIHILSNKPEIQTFYHLEGKRVSVGVQGGGTALTAAVLFGNYDIKATQSNDTFEDAVKKMEQGQLDAALFVGGAPVPFIGKLDTRFHFVRLPASPLLEQIYLRTKLGKPQYGWAAADTETYAVPSVIMGLDNRDEKYVAQMQQLVLAVLNGKGYLEANGHPKWKNSIIQMYFPTRGYEPTNQVIQIFNVLDRSGYRIIKK